jgi:hypothetical protein
LRGLFEDDDAEVRKEAGRWTNELDDSNLEQLADLASDFMASPAFIDDPTFLLLRLEETTADVPELMLTAAERFAETAGRTAADISKRAAVTHRMRAIWR